MLKIKRLIFWFSVAIGVIAVVQQLRRPARERTWHGNVLGVPYDFRLPTLSRMKDAWWDPDDPRLFSPRDFGVGWALNIPRLLQIILRKDPPMRLEDDDEPT